LSQDGLFIYKKKNNNNMKNKLSDTALDILGLLPSNQIKRDVPRYRGIMCYDGKTGGSLMVCTPSQYDLIKSATSRVGNQSVLRRQAPNGGRLI
jgi:hypothetical protein